MLKFSARYARKVKYCVIASRAHRKIAIFLTFTPPPFRNMDRCPWGIPPLDRFGPSSRYPLIDHPPQSQTQIDTYEGPPPYKLNLLNALITEHWMLRKNNY